MKIDAVALSALAVLPTAFGQTSSTGMIRSKVTGLCWELDDPTYGTDAHTSFFRPRQCDPSSSLQIFNYDPVTKVITLENGSKDKCLDGNTSYENLFLFNCPNPPPPNKVWRFVDGTPGGLANGIVRSDQGVCGQSGGSTKDYIITVPCDQVTEQFEFFTVTETSEGVFQADTVLPPPTNVTVTPPGTSTAAPTGSVASSSGDPHFKTWSNYKYDFHGGCDLVLLDLPSFANWLGLTIHIRTKINTWWSYIDTAVVQLGHQTLELQGGREGEGPHYWVNGLRGDSLVDPNEDVNLQALENTTQPDLPGFQIHYHQVSSEAHTFKIDLGHGEAISLETYKERVAVNVRANHEVHNFRGAVGLMGNYPSGDLVGRDGVTRFEYDTDAFGKEWQVLHRESMLFHEPPRVQHPTTCTMPAMDAVASRKVRRRLGGP